MSDFILHIAALLLIFDVISSSVISALKISAAFAILGYTEVGIAPLSGLLDSLVNLIW